MILLGIDIETTGTDIENDSITEIAIVSWDTEKKAAIQTASTLVGSADGVWDGREYPEDVQQLTGITIDDLRNHGADFGHVMRLLVKNAQHPMVAGIVTHNGTTFDLPFLANNITRWNERGDAPIPIDAILPSTAPLDFIDTRYDLPAPEGSRKLTYMAADHGIVNQYGHRALSDVQTMLALLSCYPIEEVLTRSQSPTVTIAAMVSYDDRDKAKQAGFFWEPASKTWRKEVKECDLMGMSELPFKIQRL
ncbi:MAG: 3'-5' exonuclease [Chromatiales bacterium]|nr:3'-5' exonuclease [Chromatiales bacterium]